MTASAPVQYGVVFPTTEIGTDPAAVAVFATAVEELGYDYLLTYDHVVGAHRPLEGERLAGPYGHDDQFHEPLVLFGFLAGRTRRLGLATGVLVLPQRQTALVAKQAAEVDLLSGGRLRLGVGLGWNPVEYDCLGVPFDRRGARLEEQVGLLRRLWTDELVDAVGAFHRFDRVAVCPRPWRTIPVWLAVTGPRSAGRCGRLGDGGVFPAADDGMCALVSTMRDAARSAGRNGDDVGAECLLDADLGPERCLERVDRWRAAGGTHVCVRTVVARSAPRPGSRPRTVDEHIAALAAWVAVREEAGREEAGREGAGREGAGR
ncbi:MAG TPA: LLM class F420-dependent oxidoreductase [Acidimicrobiales bacterium]|nr:LLM class F420-dependent oxidoreductase [Acidimicrobiales bacterium]